MTAQEEPQADQMMPSDRKAPHKARLASTWLVFVIGLGLAVTIAWIAFLGWLVLHAASFIL
jgi:hypothetical protein